MCKWGQTVYVLVTKFEEDGIPGKNRKAIKSIDFCIAPIVEALNKGGIITVASCCGHGKSAGNIVLQDGRMLIIKEEKDLEVPSQPDEIDYSVRG